MPTVRVGAKGTAALLEKNQDGPTIIVVDDCADIREVLRTVLELYGYRILEAKDGQAAVELAIQQCPDLILMDIRMPVLDGFAATRRLREIKETRHVQIVALSAEPKEVQRAAALAAGCNEYVTKPFRFKELLPLLSSLLAA
jgi:CheY-like chemotaxis protein